MKIKHLIIVGLLLTILTIGAVSASEDVVLDDTLSQDVATDDLAVDEDESLEIENDEINIINEDEELPEDPVSFDIESEVNIKDNNLYFGYIQDSEGLNGTVELYIGNQSFYSETFHSSGSWSYGSFHEFYIENVFSSYSKQNVKIVYEKFGVEEPYVFEKEVDFTYYMSFVSSTYDDFDENQPIKYGEGFYFRICLPETANCTAKIVLNGKNYDVPLKRGEGKLYLNSKDFDIGNFTAVASYSDSLHPFKTKNLTFRIIPQIYNKGVISIGEKDTIIISAPKGCSGTASFYSAVEKWDYEMDYYDLIPVDLLATVSFVDGMAIIPYGGLSEGEYQYILNFTVGNYQKSEEIYVSVRNNTMEISSKLSADEIAFGETATLTIKGPVFNDFVEICLDGNLFKSCNLYYGQIIELVSDLSVGKHKISIKVNNYDDKFYSNTLFITVKEKQIPSPPIKKEDVVKLVLKKVNVKNSAKKLVLQATLKINGKAVKGKTIKFKFNKKTYNAKTNNKGIAKVTIKKNVLKKLKKGKKVTYTATYGKVTKKITVKVKK